MENTPARAGNRPASGVFFAYEAGTPLGISTHKITHTDFRRAETSLKAFYHWVLLIVEEKG